MNGTRAWESVFPYLQAQFGRKLSKAREGHLCLVEVCVHDIKCKLQEKDEGRNIEGREEGSPSQVLTILAHIYEKLCTYQRPWLGWVEGQEQPFYHDVTMGASYAEAGNPGSASHSEGEIGCGVREERFADSPPWHDFGDESPRLLATEGG
jgi:hypothetical protein